MEARRYSLEEDLIEEIIRIKGFDNIKLVEPIRKREQETLNFSQKLFHLSQRSLASKGYLETVTWSFTDSKLINNLQMKKKKFQFLIRFLLILMYSGGQFFLI